MNVTSSILDLVSRRLLRVAVGFYFSRIERFHRERVPRLASGKMDLSRIRELAKQFSTTPKAEES